MGENCHALSGLDVCSVDDRTGPRHHRTTDDRGDIAFDVGRHLDHILLVGNGMVSPGKHVLGNGRTIADLEFGANGPSTGRPRVTWHPGHHHGVTLANVGDGRTDFQDHAG